MTGTKIWRLSIAAILGFGWLFLTPAYSDDPLAIAAQQIQELNNSVSNLNFQDDFKSYIATAQLKYDVAVSAKTTMDNAIAEYDSAVQAEATALSEKNAAQLAVDNQTQVVATKLSEKNAAYSTLQSANISLSAAKAVVDAANSYGVAFQIYPLSRTWYGEAYLDSNAGLMCQGSISTFDVWAGQGSICGLSENIIGIFRATLTVPAEINDVYFAGYTDDGFKLYINGVLETSQWQEQGSTWSPYTRHFDTSVNKTLQLEAWWYNGGGPGNMNLGWGYNGIWTGIPNAYLSYGSGATQEQINAYNTALSNQLAAQTEYNNKLSAYNSANATLITYNQILSNKTIAYNSAKLNTASKLTAKNNAIAAYNQSIIDLNNAIKDAWDYYKTQKDREIQIAIAQALANQPQPEPSPTTIEPSPEPTQTIEPTPTPEVTIEPSPQPTPEPSPEQTQPNDPTPEPSSDTTNEATPDPSLSPEPSPEPSPQTTDINPSPSSQPTQDPVLDSDKTKNTPISAQTANLIADLTNSNTLTQLTPEQKFAVAGALGIKPTEIAAVVEIAKSNPAIAVALEEFGDRANANLNAPMPYTLADATTEIQAEKLLADPIGALTNIDLEKVLSPSEWGKDMTDDQRKKAQEVVIPVIIASNLVAAAMTRRI